MGKKRSGDNGREGATGRKWKNGKRKIRSGWVGGKKGMSAEWLGGQLMTGREK